MQGLWGITLWTRDWYLSPASTGLESWATATADPQHPLKGAQGGDQEWGTLCSGKTGRAGLQIVRYFQEKILCAQLLHILISRKSTKILHGDVCSLWRAVTFRRLAAIFCKMVLGCMYIPFHLNHICPDVPTWLFGVVFQSYLKCCLLGYSLPFDLNKT